MTRNRILAVDPGTREMGVAVFEGSDLLYYGIKTVSHRQEIDDVCGSAAKIIRQFIAAYQPRSVALVRRLVIQSNCERLVAVIHEVKRAAEGEGVAVYEYAPKSVRRFLCGPKRATKQHLARIISSRYPELAQYAEGRGVWEELYYARMFAAVAAGLTDYYARAQMPAASNLIKSA